MLTDIIFKKHRWDILFGSLFISAPFLGCLLGELIHGWNTHTSTEIQLLIACIFLLLVVSMEKIRADYIVEEIEEFHKKIEELEKNNR